MHDDSTERRSAGSGDRALQVLRAFLPHAERDEVCEELAAERRARAQRDGRFAARLWLWRQVLASLPALVGRMFFRGLTGFEPASSRFRPGGPRMESLILDVRYTLRRLASRPLYATLVVLTLALGIGGTAASFGLVRGLLLSPLPYPQPDRLGIFWFQGSWSEREYLALNPDWPGFSGVAIFNTHERPIRFRTGEPPQIVRAVYASAGLFDTLGVQPERGRGFQPGDDRPGAEPVVVVSHALYEQLGGTPSVLGRTVEVDGAPNRVIGVMPEGFFFPDPTVGVWRAEPMNADDGSGNYDVVARRAPGTDGPALALALHRIASRLGERFHYPPDWDKTRAPAMTPIADQLLGPLRAPLWATLAAMLILLVIACANVSALMLGQMDSRAGELAVRMALGADNRRMAQQVLSEALLLGLGAALLGAGVAVIGYHVLSGALPLGELAGRSHLDWGVFFAALVLAIVGALLSSWLPLRALRRTGPQRALAASRTDGIGARGGTTEGVLVIGQVALAALLLIGAALLVRSVAKLGAISPGLDTDRVAVVDVVMEATTTPERREQVLEEIDRGLSALPGVEAAGATLQLPLRGSSQNWGIDIREKPELPASTTFVRLVSPDYFRVMGIRLVKGRLFDQSDRPDTQRAVVINQALAQKYFAGEDPLGKEIGTGLGGWERVVGVVENVAEGNLADPAPTPARYMLYRQTQAITPPYTTLVLRAAPGKAPASLLGEARTKLGEVAPSVAIEKTTTLREVLEKAIGPAKQVRSVLALLTLFAVLLGMVGVYGVTSHFVRRRQRDLGIRMALGLTPRGLVRQVVGRAARMVLAGIALGTVAALVLVRLLTSLLYGVSAVDPISLVASGACLLVIGVLAAAYPAWRASRLDPSVLFRER